MTPGILQANRRDGQLQSQRVAAHKVITFLDIIIISEGLDRNLIRNVNKVGIQP